MQSLKFEMVSRLYLNIEVVSCGYHSEIRNSATLNNAALNSASINSSNSKRAASITEALKY